MEKFDQYISDNSVYTILDTGSSTLAISALYFEDLIEKIFEYVGSKNYEFSNGIIASQCDY